jgi:hypothetical protein
LADIQHVRFALSKALVLCGAFPDEDDPKLASMSAQTLARLFVQYSSKESQLGSKNPFISLVVSLAPRIALGDAEAVAEVGRARKRQDAYAAMSRLLELAQIASVNDAGQYTSGLSLQELATTLGSCHLNPADIPYHIGRCAVAAAPRIAGGHFFAVEWLAREWKLDQELEQQLTGADMVKEVMMKKLHEAFDLDDGFQDRAKFSIVDLANVVAHSFDDVFDEYQHDPVVLACRLAVENPILAERDPNFFAQMMQQALAKEALLALLTEIVEQSEADDRISVPFDELKRASVIDVARFADQFHLDAAEFCFSETLETACKDAEKIMHNNNFATLNLAKAQLRQNLNLQVLGLRERQLKHVMEDVLVTAGLCDNHARELRGLHVRGVAKGSVGKAASRCIQGIGLEKGCRTGRSHYRR